MDNDNRDAQTIKDLKKLVFDLGEASCNLFIELMFNKYENDKGQNLAIHPRIQELKQALDNASEYALSNEVSFKE